MPAACAALCLSAAVTSAWAGEEDDSGLLDPAEARISDWAKPGPVMGSTWRGDLESGLLSTTGNEEQRSALGRAHFENDRELWRHTGRGDFLIQEQPEGTRAEQYRVLQKSAYKLSL